MDFEFSLKNVDGRLFLHSVLTAASGEKSEKDLSVLVSSSLEEAHPDMVPLSLSEKVVVWIHPSDLQSIVSETYDIREFLRMDESQVKSLIKVGNLFEKTIPLSLHEKESLAEELGTTFHGTLLHDRGFALRSVIVDENLFSKLPDEFKHDPNFLIQAHEFNPLVLRHIDAKLASDPKLIEFIENKIRLNELNIRTIPIVLLYIIVSKTSLLSDPLIASRLLKQNEHLFSYVGAELKSDMRFFLDVYESNPRILRFVPTELVDRREFVEFMAEKLARHEIDFRTLPASILSSEWFVGVLLNQPVERRRMEEFSQLNSYIPESSQFIFRLILLKPECMRFITNRELDHDFFKEACVSVVEKLAQDCAAIQPDPSHHTVPIPFYGDLSSDLKNCKEALEKLLMHTPNSIHLLIEDSEVSKNELKKIAAEHVMHHLFHLEYFSNLDDFDMTFEIAMFQDTPIEQLELLSHSFPRLGLLLDHDKITPTIMRNLQQLVMRDYSALFSEEFKEMVAIKSADKEGVVGEALYQFDHKADLTRLKKALAQVAGIGGFSEGVELEGDWDTFYEKMIADTSLAVFSDELEAVYQKPFEEASVSSRSSRVVLREYRKGSPVLINSGYSGGASGHSVVLVLQGEHLMICNRGNRDLKFSSMTYHQIDPAKVDEALIEFLSQSKGVASVDAQNLLIYEFLPTLLEKQPKDEELKGLIEEHVKTKDQVVGNCSCASPKAAFKALAFFHHFNRLSDRPIGDRVKDASLMANLDAKKMSIALRKKMEEQIQHDPSSKEIYDISRVKTLKMQLKYTTHTFEELEKLTKEFSEFVSTSTPETLKTLPEFDKLVRLLIRKRRELYPRLYDEIGTDEGILAFQLTTWKIQLTYAFLQVDDLDEIFHELAEFTRTFRIEMVETNLEWNLFIEEYLEMRKLYMQAYKDVPEFPYLSQDLAAKTSILKLWFQAQSGRQIQEIFAEVFELFMTQRISKIDVDLNPVLQSLVQLLLSKRKEFLRFMEESEEDKRLHQTLSLETAVFELLFLRATPDGLDELFHLFESVRAEIPSEMKADFPNYQNFLTLLKKGFEECRLFDERYRQINEELSR
jgi:hypothetical protein